MLELNKGDTMEEIQINYETERRLNELNKVYGINLKQLSVVKVEGKEYIKFYDSNENIIKMIHNGDQSLNEYFKNLQEKLSLAQTKNEQANAKNIFDYEEKYVRESITLISVLEVKNNFETLTNHLEGEKLRLVTFLVQNADNLDLAYINVNQTLCVNSSQEVFYPYYDQVNNKYIIKKAEEKKYETTNKYVYENNNLLEFDSIDFDSIAEKIEVPTDEPIIISGEEINLEELNNYIIYPELLEKQQETNQITEKRKTIIKLLIEAMQRRQENKLKNPDKRLVLKLPNESAFVDALLLAIISGVVFLTVSALIII